MSVCAALIQSVLRPIHIYNVASAVSARPGGWRGSRDTPGIQLFSGDVDRAEVAIDVNCDGKLLTAILGATMGIFEYLLRYLMTASI